MVVKCNPQLKTTLLGKKKDLAGQVDPEGFKYFLAPYLPEAFKAAKNKHREELSSIYEANRGKLPKNRTNAKVVGPDLMINGKIKRGFIQPPAPGEVCAAKKDYAVEFDSFDLLATCPLSHDGSTFYGFAVRASSLLAVFLTYCKVRIQVLKARHILCAYKVAGMSDSCNDGEDHGGLQMAKALQKSGYHDVAIYIARETGIDKLGVKRFEFIKTLCHELFQILNNSTGHDPINKAWVPKHGTPGPPHLRMSMNG